MAAFRTMGMWLQLAADIVVACLVDGPAGAGKASRVERRADRRRQRLFGAAH